MKKPYKIITYNMTISGFALSFDGIAASTPHGKPFNVPSRALVEGIIEEWKGNGNRGSEHLYLTKLAYAAIDIFSDNEQRTTNNDELLAYADTDLVCYRAGGAPLLQKEQTELLDPLIRWAEAAFGITLYVTDGIIPVAQPEGNRRKLAVAMAGYDGWKMAALAACVRLLGSLVLALALMEGHISAEAAFRLSQLEEAYEIKRWGDDGEKKKRLEGIRREIIAVCFFLDCIK